MDISQIINNALEAKLKDGTLEKLISEKLDAMISDSIGSAFSWGGECRKALDAKLKEIMLPTIEQHNFSEYLVKLDTVLADIINHTTLVDNANMLEMFKGLMSEPADKQISIKTIFEEYCKFVAKNVDTDGMEIDYDNGQPRYMPLTCAVEITEPDSVWRSSSFDYLDVIFSCDLTNVEEADKFAFAFKLSRYNGYKDPEPWTISYYGDVTITSLRYINDFMLLIMRLARARTEILVGDEKYLENDDVVPDAIPEQSWS